MTKLQHILANIARFYFVNATQKRNIPGLNPPFTNLRYFTYRLLRASSCCISQSRKKMSPTHHERYTNLNCLLHRCMTRYTTHLSCSSAYSLVSSPSFTDCRALYLHCRPRLKRFAFFKIIHMLLRHLLSTSSFRFPSCPTH